MRSFALVVACLAVAVAVARPARAQMMQCWPGTAVDLGVVPARTPEAVAAADGDRVMVVTLRDTTTLYATPFTNGTAGAAVRIAIPAGEHPVDVLRVRDVWALRTVGVCPNTGRAFHKCVHFRVLANDATPRGAVLDEDVVEWSGVGAAVVVGDRIITVRTPMYDAGGVPSVASYVLSAAGDAIVRDGALRPLGPDARPDAHAVLAAHDGHWAALVTSQVGEVPPLLVTGDGAHVAPVPRLPTELVPTQAALEPDGTVAVRFDDGRVVRLAPDGSLRGRLARVASDVDLPASLSAVRRPFVLRVERGDVKVVDPRAVRGQRPYATLGRTGRRPPVLSDGTGPKWVVVLFVQQGRELHAQARPMTCGVVWQH